MESKELSDGDSNLNTFSNTRSTRTHTKVDGDEISQAQSDDESRTEIASGDAHADGSGGLKSNDADSPQLTKVKALFDYVANPDDPTELSFKRGDIFEITEKSGLWWAVKTDDGERKTVPSNYFEPKTLEKAKALYNYVASPEDPMEISFSKGDVFDIINKTGKWWSVRTASGERRIVPSNYFESERARAQHNYVPSPDKTNELVLEHADVPRSIIQPKRTLEDTSSGVQTKKARALYDYTPDPSDPDEISFKKGDILDIFDSSGRWWSVLTASMDLKIAPSNYLQLV